MCLIINNILQILVILDFSSIPHQLDKPNALIYSILNSKNGTSEENEV